MTEPAPPVNLHVELPQAIQRSADYLLRNVQPDGQFVYRINLDPRYPPQPRYNLLRHAGTMYALARYARHTRSTALLDALQRSAHFLRASALAPVDEDPSLLAVWSRPEVTGIEPLEAKLGGAGLALVALASLEEIAPGSTSLAELQGLGQFVLFMQKEDGSFYSKYCPEDGGRTDRWTSLYYPGEAALGLVMLYELDRSPQWLAAAARALSFLARLREGQDRVEADHWALLATARLLAHAEDCPSLDHPLLAAHAKQICRSIFQDQCQVPANSPLHGGFASDGRTCPTATRLEGLLAALPMLDQLDPPLARQAREAVEAGIAFLLRAQVRTPPHEGGIPRAIRRLPEGHPRATRSFNRRATEIRIDYVQHALCAMLEYQDQTSSATP